MALELVAEKKSIGQLQGLILSWNCGYCEKLNIKPLVRKEAASGEKNCFCSHCKEESVVTFSSSTMMSQRERIVQQGLSFITSSRHSIILEDLAWIEALFVIEGLESFANSYWEYLITEINYWGLQDRYNE
jgi:hypothetical protein